MEAIATDMVVRGMLIGAGATLAMDAWGLLVRRVFGVRSLDYALVGRWLGHMPRGRFAHAPIAASPPVAGERAIGWIAHYATGVAFAGLLLATGGEDWARHPTPGLALAVGVATVVAPFFVMQPGMGLGFAASRTPKPMAARLRSLTTHTVFGVGLYAAAWIVARVIA